MRIRSQFRRDRSKRSEILGGTECAACFCFCQFLCLRFPARTIRAARRDMDIRRATTRLRRRHTATIRLAHRHLVTTRPPHRPVITHRGHRPLTPAFRLPIPAARHTAQRTVARLTRRSLAHHCHVFHYRIILRTADRPAVSKVVDERGMRAVPAKTRAAGRCRASGSSRST